MFKIHQNQKFDLLKFFQNYEAKSPKTSLKLKYEPKSCMTLKSRNFKNSSKKLAKNVAAKAKILLNPKVKKPTNTNNNG